MSKGCTIALIIVGIIVVIGIIGIAIIWMNADKIKNAGIDYMVDGAAEQIKLNLPEGYTEEYVDELLAELKLKLKNSEIEPEAIQKLTNTYQATMADEILDVEEATDFLQDIQEALGKESPVLEEEVIDSLTAEPAGA